MGSRRSRLRPCKSCAASLSRRTLHTSYGAALLAEYEDLLCRESIWRKARLTATEREDFLDIFLSICQWTRIYYAWRPNLGHEADNHLMELAVAGQADYLVTRNVRHLRGGELKFPHISVITPTQLLKERA